MIRHRPRPIAVALLLAVVALTVTGLPSAVVPDLPQAPGYLAGVVRSGWPQWVHDLADVLQIVTAALAFMVWWNTGRTRR